MLNIIKNNKITSSDRHPPNRLVQQAANNEYGGCVLALRYLLKLNKVKQSALPEIGIQSIVSKRTSGKQALTLDNVKRLGFRFNVSSSTFIDH